MAIFPVIIAPLPTRDGPESLVLEVYPRSGHAAIVQANKDVESREKCMVGAGDRMQKSLER
jgi:hypothetical protein